MAGEANVDWVIKSCDSEEVAKKDQSPVVRVMLKRMSSEAMNMTTVTSAEEVRNASSRHIIMYVTLPDM